MKSDLKEELPELCEIISEATQVRIVKNATGSEFVFPW